MLHKNKFSFVLAGGILLVGLFLVGGYAFAHDSGRMTFLEEDKQIQLFPGDWIVGQMKEKEGGDTTLVGVPLSELHPTWVMQMGGIVFAQNTGPDTSFSFIRTKNENSSAGATFYFPELIMEEFSGESPRPVIDGQNRLVFTLSGEPFRPRDFGQEGSRGVYVRINSTEWEFEQKRSPYPASMAFANAPILGTYLQFGLEEALAQRVVVRILAFQAGKMVLKDIVATTGATTMTTAAFCVVAAPVTYVAWRMYDEVDAQILWHNIFRFGEWAARNAALLSGGTEAARLTIERLRGMGDEEVSRRIGEDLPDISQALEELLRQEITNQKNREAIQRALDAYRRVLRHKGNRQNDPDPEKPGISSWGAVKALANLFLAEELYSLYDPRYQGLLERISLFGEYVSHRVIEVDYSVSLTSQGVRTWEESEISQYMAGLILESGNAESFHWRFRNGNYIWEMWFQEFFYEDVSFDSKTTRYLYAWSHVLGEGVRGHNLRLLVNELDRRRGDVAGIDQVFYQNLLELSRQWKLQSFPAEKKALADGGVALLRQALGKDLERSRFLLPVNFGKSEAFYVEDLPRKKGQTEVTASFIKASILSRFGLSVDAGNELRAKKAGQFVFFFLEGVEEAGFLVNRVTMEMFYLRGHGNTVTRLALSGFGPVETYVDVSGFDHGYDKEDLLDFFKQIQPGGTAYQLADTANGGVSSVMYGFEDMGVVAKRFKFGHRLVKGGPVAEYQRQSLAYEGKIATPKPFGLVRLSTGESYLFMERMSGYLPFNRAVEEGLLDGQKAIEFANDLQDKMKKIGVAHGDIRLWNILVSVSTGELKILDWGLGSVRDELFWDYTVAEDGEYLEDVRKISKQILKKKSCIHLPATWQMKVSLFGVFDKRGLSALEGTEHGDLVFSFRYPKGKKFVYVLDMEDLEDRGSPLPPMQRKGYLFWP